MSEATTGVPTIAETIRAFLRGAGYANYANMAVIDQVSAALTERERRLYGGTAPTDQPVTEEILRRLDSDAADPESLPVTQRLARLETEVANLTGFARENGYRL